MARDNDGYTLLDGSGHHALKAAPSRSSRQRRVRNFIFLAALVVVLCAGYAAFSWEDRPRACRAEDFKLVRFVSGGGEEPLSAFELSAWPKRIDDGGDVVVSWTAKRDCVVQSEDYLTLSCGPTLGDGDYLQRKNVTETDATVNSVRFSDLYMMRCNYVVKYFISERATKTFAVLAQIEVGMKDSFSAPKHGHVALTENDSEMAVMFNSASIRVPQVRYGLRASELSMSAQGSSTTYTAADMCHAPAATIGQPFFRDPGYMHKVILTKLQADQVYFYQFGNEQDGWSRVRSFRSKPDAAARSAKFIAYGDMGVDGAPAAQSTAARVFEDVVGSGYDSFLLHFGDVSYARGKAHVWDKFFHLIEPYATRMYVCDSNKFPYMVSVGNHEYDYTSGGEHDPSGGAGSSGTGFHPSWGNFGADSGGECSVPMHHRWHATGNGIYWYSFDYAGIHVVQISTEHNWTRGSEQFEWLKRDLESVNRTATPWIILTGHRMMYTTQIVDGVCSVNLVAAHLRTELEELMHEHRVNLMLVGHQHAYERSCPVYKGECVDHGSATVHVLAGSAGFEIDSTEFSTACGNWSVSHVNEYGYLRVDTSPERMHVQFVLNKNGVVYDEVTVLPWKA